MVKKLFNKTSFFGLRTQSNITQTAKSNKLKIAVKVEEEMKEE